ncbi:MAG TPA: SMC-Scp complex subunit ScpB [Firmicutes bacterium]|nr:SMC-Scp complex subunit ScpB [Bacillota bacterium]
MDKEKLINVLEAILFASGKEVEIDFLLEKLQISRVAFEKALKSLQDKYSGDCGINVIKFKNKLQFATNPKYIDDVAEVLNPIREKELTKAMLETLSIIAYKQPITRLEIEEIRGVDCTYAVQTLSKMNMIEVVGKKDAVGKPLLFGTTDEFLKRFSLSDLSDLPSFESLTDRIQTIATPGGDSQLFDMKSNENINFEETSPKEEIPEFLRGEDVDVIE